jgi:hypothetical protein
MAVDHLVPAVAGQDFPVIAEPLISTLWKEKKKTKEKKREKSVLARLLLDHASR